MGSATHQTSDPGGLVGRGWWQGCGWWKEGGALGSEGGVGRAQGSVLGIGGCALTGVVVSAAGAGACGSVAVGL